MILYDGATRAKWRALGGWDDITVDDMLCEHAVERGGRTAIVDPSNRAELYYGEPRCLTWQELAQAVGATAARLSAIGLRKDSILVYQLPNTVELPILFLACARLGVVMSPLPMQYGRHEFALTFAQLPAVAAVVVASPFRGEDVLARTAAILNSIDRRIMLYEVRDLTDGPEMPEVLPAERPTADDVLTICWTSGTTGAPKGVPRTHNNWRWAGRSMCEAAGCEQGEIMLTPFPAVNHGGIGSGLMPWLTLGATSILHHPLDLPLMLEQIAAHRVVTTVAAPAVLAMWLKSGAADRHDLASLKRIISGSAPLAPWIVQTFRERFDVDVINMLGSNEGAAMCADPRDLGDDDCRSSRFIRIGTSRTFRFARDTDAYLADPATDDPIEAPGVPGELRLKSPGIISGYLDGQSDPFDARGYLKTGDLFALAPDRNDALTQMAFIGRSKDLIIRGGQNIAPAEIEGLLEMLPACREAAVVGVPDALMGERACACIALRPGESLTLEDIRAAFRAQGVAPMKWPERLELFDALPRNPMNKVLKHELLSLVDARANLKPKEATA